MALRFFTSSESTLEVVITCDPAIDATDEAKNEYLKTGDLSLLGDHEGSTIFKLKALGPESKRAHTFAQNSGGFYGFSNRQKLRSGRGGIMHLKKMSEKRLRCIVIISIRSILRWFRGLFKQLITNPLRLIKSK
jgi:hypothetical protein